MHGNTATVAGAVAVRTACAALDGRDILAEQCLLLRRNCDLSAAVRTHLAHQSLRDQTDQRICDQIVVDAHIGQTDDARDRIVGMQRTQHQMTGDGRTNRNTGGFAVTGLTDHDDIRILTQQRAQTGLKRQSGNRIDLRLVDARHVLLHRILNRGDIHLPVRQILEHHVQCGGLTRTGRTGDINNAVR